MPADNPTTCGEHRPEQWARCMAFQQAIELLGRRWTGVIVFMLLQRPHRYNELLASVHGISDRLLTERLRELEEFGLVERHVIPDSPVRVEYSLTEAGRDAEACVSTIFKWGNKWFMDETTTANTTE